MDDLDLPVMTKMSFEHMRQKLKCLLNCVQDLTDNVDKPLITVEELRDKLEYLEQRRNTGCGFYSPINLLHSKEKKSIIEDKHIGVVQ